MDNEGQNDRMMLYRRARQSTMYCYQNGGTAPKTMGLLPSVWFRDRSHVQEGTLDFQMKQSRVILVSLLLLFLHDVCFIYISAARLQIAAEPHTLEKSHIRRAVVMRQGQRWARQGRSLLPSLYDGNSGATHSATRLPPGASVE